MQVDKRLIIVGVLVLGLAVLLFRGEEEPTEPAGAKTAPPPTAASPPRREPRPPAPHTEERARDWYYGYYGRPGYAPAPPPTPRSEGGRWSGEPSYAGPGWPGPAEPERFRFRPLDERERARMEASTPSSEYTYPYYSAPERPRDERGRDQRRWDPYPAEPYPQQAYPGWQREGYGYRAPERPWGAPGGGIGPDLSPDYGNAWTLPPESPTRRQAPAWEPPEGRMYPSLPSESERRFTVR